jgi:hypothetical protein
MLGLLGLLLDGKKEPIQRHQLRTLPVVHGFASEGTAEAEQRFLKYRVELHAWGLRELAAAIIQNQ